MFFKSEGATVQILSVSDLSWEAAFHHVRSRPYSALVLRVSGTGDFRFPDGTTIHTKAGEILYMPRGFVYDVDYSRGEIFVFHFITEVDSAPCILSNGDSSKMLPLFKRAVELCQQKMPWSLLEITSLFYLILADIVREKPRSVSSNSGFLSAVALLEKEYRDPDVTISRICHEAFISESTFRRLFTQQFGKSPIRYLSELRLHLAEELLLSTDMTVEQISMATGFRDPKYFCRFVKHHRGCTPTELRTF